MYFIFLILSTCAALCIVGMVLVDGLQVAAVGKGATGEITVPPKACR